ncbi:hypothetical protein E1A91_D05G160400v1 [Gossypium mustelinum]|uniref:Uncharacterized protein n=1 Tax=Gossypium mustelinum TaxID=34275 RepID=A0A5D2UX73_GOSMU|nr:hypothetical protein E1A91_D05G160400v1 [Gossypium mustelinum]
MAAYPDCRPRWRQSNISIQPSLSFQDKHPEKLLFHLHPYFGLTRFHPPKSYRRRKSCRSTCQMGQHHAQFIYSVCYVRR